jgi:acetyl esterase
MPVKPEVAEFLEAVKKLGLKPVAALSPDAAREQMEAGVRARNLPEVPVGSVDNRTIPGPAGEIPVRVYRPDGADGRRGALVYFHGGGHVIGSLDTHDSVARAMCRNADIVVLSVDYRMGPEHKFPAAVEDCYAACQWLHANAGDIGVDPDRIAVGGDSAGGNLALVVSLMARDNAGPPLAFQLLVYPVMDYAGGTRTYETFAKGYGPLEADTMRWFRDHYLRGGDDVADWRASPDRADSFAGLPPALLITAECDVLNEEGKAAAKRLADDGVPTEHADFAGMIHGFFSMAPIFADATAAQSLAADRLRAALSPK